MSVTQLGERMAGNPQPTVLLINNNQQVAASEDFGPFPVLLQMRIEDIDLTHRRGLERRLMASLVTCDWIRAHHNLHLTGPTGTGKSWLACALGQQACRQGLSVRYERVARLLETLRIARGDGSYHKRLAALAKTDLLILDDFGLSKLLR
jgi:DNA replication protein DnaC